ncbi:MAG: hypothetical protein JNK82_45905 [Myxococcaceae bacterium]|nr:hypothetical protein [Myxococcaceae bacterium]
MISGCFTRSIADHVGRRGWFQANEERFRSAGFDYPGCPLLPGDSTKPVVVLVHGIGGEGPEMAASVPLLREWDVFMFRWVPYEDRDEAAQRLADGVTRLSACAPERQLLVLAHSAGGVVASHAASRVKLSPEAKLDVWTVASPLAGTVRRAGNADGRAEAVLMLDLGSRISRYPIAARGVSVKHLRTSAAADDIMQPTGDLVPNDVKVGVPGAPQLDLPDNLTHGGALVWVVGQLVRGDAEVWLTPAAQSKAF